MFEKVKRFYDLGIYTKEQVAQFVTKGKLTKADYKKITEQEAEEILKGV